MIWLDISEENGRVLYLDIRGIEPRHRGNETIFSLTGVLGDGLDETEILIEIGRLVEVTFVDEWLHNGRHSDLLSRLDQEELKKVLVEQAAAMSFRVEDMPAWAGIPRQRVREYRTELHWLPVRPHPYREQLELPLLVSEAAA